MTFDRDLATREPTVEVAHEALLREWPRLVDWLREDTALLQSLDELSRAATTWDAGGREGADLYRGGRLELAAGLASAAGERMRPADVDFIGASQAADVAERRVEGRRVTRLRTLVGVVGAALILAVVAGGLAFRQAAAARDATEQAELATLVSRSVGSTAENPELALLLALEAHEREQQPDTRQAVLNSLAANATANSLANLDLIVEPNSPCGFSVASPDGTVDYGVWAGEVGSRNLETGEITSYGPPPEECVVWFVDEAKDRRWAGSLDAMGIWLGSADGSWDVQRSFEQPTVVESFAFRSSGLLVGATGFEDGDDTQLVLIDDTSGETVGVPIDVEGRFFYEVNDDGSLIAVSITADGSNDTRLKLFDGLTGLELWDRAMDAPATALAFDDGHVLVGLADRRLLSIDEETGDIVAVLETTATDDFLDIGVRPDGLIVAATGTQIELIDPRTGPTGTAVDLRGVVEAHIRPDGTVLTLSFETEQFSIVDLDLSALVESAIRVEPGSVVMIADNHAGVTVPQSGLAEWIDLASGDRVQVALEAPGSGLFAAATVFPDSDGLWAIDDAGTLARWEDNVLIDRLSIGDGYRTGAREGNRFAAVLGEAGSRRASLTSLEPEAATLLFEADVATAVLAQPRDDGGMYVLDASGTLFTFISDGDGNGVLTNEVVTGVEGATILAVDATNGQVAVAASAGGLVVVDPVMGRTIELPDAGFVGGIGFAESGSLLVVTSLDGTVQLFDAESAAMIGTLWPGSGAVVGSPAWYDESTRSMWVGSSERLLRIPLTPERWLERACEVLTRDLSSAEWDDLVPGDLPQRSTCRGDVLVTEWEQGLNGQLPGGTIRLPELGGIKFELEGDRTIRQDRAYTILDFDGDDQRSEINLVAARATPDDVLITNVDELLTAMNDFVKADLLELEPVETSIGVARTFDYEWDRDLQDGSSFIQAGEGAWGPPLPVGRFWMMETERGVFLVTVEAFDRDDSLYAETIAAAETLLATIEFVDF